MSAAMRRAVVVTTTAARRRPLPCWKSGRRRCSSCPRPADTQLIATAISARTPFRSGSPPTSSPRASRECARCCSRPSSKSEIALNLDIAAAERGATFLQAARLRGIPAVPGDLRRTGGVRLSSKQVGKWLRESLGADVDDAAGGLDRIPCALAADVPHRPLRRDTRSRGTTSSGCGMSSSRFPMARSRRDAAGADDRVDARAQRARRCTTTGSTRRCRRSPSPRSALLGRRAA